MNLLRLTCRLLLAAWFASAVEGAAAHDAPDQVIAALTAAMERRGKSPELLYRRGCEQRVLGSFAEAEADFAAAVADDPSHFSAGLELARVRVALGRLAAAYVAVQHAEPFAESDAERAACAMIECQIARSAGDVATALQECRSVCRLLPKDIEAVLLRSRLQAQAGQFSDRVRDLEVSARENSSIAIKIELIEAKLDAGLYEDVLDELQTELDASRLKASWRLRRARALKGLARDAEAAVDLQLAVEELDRRISPERPDVGLLIERGLALALLGETTAAHADLVAARRCHADAWQIDRVKRFIESAGNSGS